MPLTNSEKEAINPFYWVRNQQFVNENGFPLEWENYNFLRVPFTDMSPRQAILKAAQIGFSTMEILKGIHIAKYFLGNVIHTLPTKTVVKDFVEPKVNALLKQNPKLQKTLGDTDTISLKGVGDRYIYYRGSFEEKAAISISAHVLIMDEYDRSNQTVLELYKTRLGSAKRERPDLGWIWIFSNPSTPNFGVHAEYLKSDQKIWMIKCSHCNRYQEMTWPESICLERKVYQCKLCGSELTNEDRRLGKWVAQYPGREISGYHISKLFVPWVSAKEIIEASRGDTQIFYNFYLGLPYIDPDIQVTRESIINAIVLTDNEEADVAMGVDNGVIKHYTIGNCHGIFRQGTTKKWSEIERLHKQYNAVTVVDALPYPTQVKRLANRYRGRLFAHYYSPDKRQLGIVRWGEKDERGKVLSDRSGVIDLVADEINHQDIVFNMPEHQLEEYISHWENIYRVVEKDEKGKVKIDWITQANKPDHFCHSTVLWRVAMEKRRLSGGGPVSSRKYRKKKEPESIMLEKYGFGKDVKAHAPGYDLDKLKQVLDRPKRQRQRNLYSPPA